MANQPIAKHILEQNAVLRNTLAPLARYYDDLGTVEMRINRPGKVVTERRGIGKEEHDAPELTIAVIEHICKSLANGEGLQFDSSKAPKLSCVLPVIKHRFECLVGNSVQSGLSMAIRCKHPFTPEWSDFISDYKPAKSKLITNDNARAFASANTKEWEQVKDNKTIAMDVKLKAYLRDAMDQEKNIIISGATNTGKTTLLNMMLGFLPADRRVVGAEDTPELDLDRFWDGVGLIAAREAGTGSGLIDWRQLYDHKMRITPDNIIYGEISTQNAIGALAVLNSGATGVMCSIHAESPDQALNRKFDQNVAWSGHSMPKVPEFLNELVDTVIQIKRSRDGMRRITDIFEARDNQRFIMKDGEFVL